MHSRIRQNAGPVCPRAPNGPVLTRWRLQGRVWDLNLVQEKRGGLSHKVEDSHVLRALVSRSTKTFGGLGGASTGRPTHGLPTETSEKELVLLWALHRGACTDWQRGRGSGTVMGHSETRIVWSGVGALAEHPGAVSLASTWQCSGGGRSGPQRALSGRPCCAGRWRSGQVFASANSIAHSWRALTAAPGDRGQCRCSRFICIYPSTRSSGQRRRVTAGLYHGQADCRSMGAREVVAEGRPMLAGVYITQKPITAGSVLSQIKAHK